MYIKKNCRILVTNFFPVCNLSKWSLKSSPVLRITFFSRTTKHPKSIKFPVLIRLKFRWSRLIKNFVQKIQSFPHLRISESFVAAGGTFTTEARNSPLRYAWQIFRASKRLLVNATPTPKSNKFIHILYNYISGTFYPNQLLLFLRLKTNSHLQENSPTRKLDINFLKLIHFSKC